MSKFTKFVTLLVLLAFILTACGGNNTANNNTAENTANNTANNTTNNTPEEEPEPADVPEPSAQGVNLADLDGVEVEFWHVWSGGAGDAMQAIIDEFNATNEYGITVIGYDQGGYGEIFTNMNAAINTGELPDIAIGYSNQYLAWHSAGEVIVDLNPYVADGTVGLSDADVADFYAGFWGQDELDGVRYGLPAQRSGQTMFYNVTWAQELGFDSPPTTPDEFYAQACAAAAANGDGTGGWFLHTGGSTLAGWIFAFGGELENADGYTFDTPETLAAFEFMYKLYADGCAWLPEARYPNAEFAARLGLFYTSSIAGLPYQLGDMETAGNTDEWAAIAFPSVTGEPIVNVYGPSMAMVVSSPEEQLASWLFIKYFTETTSQVTWIENSAYFPTRASASDALASYGEDNPIWANALAMLTNTKFEPRYESWSSVRYTISDYAVLMFQEDFDPADIPALIADMQAESQAEHAETLE